MPTIRYANDVNDANDAFQYKPMVRRKLPMEWMVAIVGHSVTEGTNGDTIWKGWHWILSASVATMSTWPLVEEETWDMPVMLTNVSWWFANG